MSHSIKIVNVSEGYSQPDNASFTEVEVEISKDGTVQENRKFGFPLDTSKEDITETLGKVRYSLDRDDEIRADNAVREQALKVLEDAKSLVNTTI